MRSGATYVFDEIDAGVGGSTARAVGNGPGPGRGAAGPLHHASSPGGLTGQTHFRIEKSVARGQATATVERVGDELVDEIVRMLGGPDGDEAADRHARELLRAA